MLYHVSGLLKLCYETQEWNLFLGKPHTQQIWASEEKSGDI